MLDSQGKTKRKLGLQHYFLVGVIALVIDFAILHSGSHAAGFDVPENELYFIAKFAVILAAVWLFHRIKNAVVSILATGLLGSAMFSAYYALVRPDLFGIADSGYSQAVVYSLEQSVIIYLVHAVGIAVGYAVVLMLQKNIIILRK